MPVFKLYMKIVWSKRFMLLIYMGVFWLITILISSSAGKTDAVRFHESSVAIGIVDRDASALSKLMTDYLKEKHEIIALEDEKEVMQDALYNNEAVYIIIVPEGFGASYEKLQAPDASAANTKLLSLETVKPVQSSAGYLVDTQLEEYLTDVRAYLLAGSDIKMAAEKASDLQEIQTAAAFVKGTDADAAMPPVYYLMLYMPYAMLSLVIIAFATVLLSFNRIEVRKRNYCSSTSLKSFNFQIGLGCLLLTLGIVALLMILGTVLYRKDLLQLPLQYLIGNILSFAAASMSLGFLTGFITENENSISILANLLGLGLSFLGGIFVPQDLLNPKILPLAKLLPTYWYVQNNDMIFQNATLDSSQLQTLLQNCGIQIAFAFAVFAIALLISKRKTEAITC